MRRDGVIENIKRTLEFRQNIPEHRRFVDETYVRKEAHVPADRRTPFASSSARRASPQTPDITKEFSVSDDVQAERRRYKNGILKPLLTLLMVLGFSVAVIVGVVVVMVNVGISAGLLTVAGGLSLLALSRRWGRSKDNA